METFAVVALIASALPRAAGTNASTPDVDFGDLAVGTSARTMFRS
jgi:hypothetical protein